MITVFRERSVILQQLWAVSGFNAIACCGFCFLPYSLEISYSKLKKRFLYKAQESIGIV